MPAVLILDDRYPQGDDAFIAVRVFRVPTEVPGSTHDLKYSLAYGESRVRDSRSSLLPLREKGWGRGGNGHDFHDLGYLHES
jgi:hypothetical protein